MEKNMLPCPGTPSPVSTTPGSVASQSSQPVVRPGTPAMQANLVVALPNTGNATGNGRVSHLNTVDEIRDNLKNDR